MGMFDGMFGGFNPQMPIDPGLPMAINQQGQNGQGGLFGMMGGQGQQPGGGLLGLNFGGQQPIADIGGQGQGLFGFGSPGQGGMNPMMRFGLGMAGMPMGGQQMMPQQFAMRPQQQQPRQPGSFNPHQLY